MSGWGDPHAYDNLTRIQTVSPRWGWGGDDPRVGSFQHARNWPVVPSTPSPSYRIGCRVKNSIPPLRMLDLLPLPASPVGTTVHDRRLPLREASAVASSALLPPITATLSLVDRGVAIRRPPVSTFTRVRYCCTTSRPPGSRRDDEVGQPMPPPTKIQSSPLRPPEKWSFPRCNW